MRLTIIGSGYVGLTTGTCFAQVGHDVTCVDNNEQKIETLKEGNVPFYEPGLAELIKKNTAEGRLHFTSSITQGIEQAEVIFIAVPTPPKENGTVDLSFMEKVSREIANALTPDRAYCVIVDKSTVPVKTGDKVYETVKRYAPKGVDFDVVSNPEFLREGCAVDDLLHPDRIVIGADSERARNVMENVYKPFNAPILQTDVNSAELIKHAANSFLALKISYINALSKICEATGADISLVADGIGMDKRISRHFLNAGLGYGGSCFPKDIKAFIHIGKKLGVPMKLLKEVESINESQRMHFLDRIREKLWVFRDKKIALWGLAFKPDTDDVRESVAIKLCQEMAKEKAIITAYDPKASETAAMVLANGEATIVDDMYECVKDAEVLVIATEWNCFVEADLIKVQKLMRTPIVFDGRNCLDLDKVRQAKLEYHCIGRPSIYPEND